MSANAETESPDYHEGLLNKNLLSTVGVSVSFPDGSDFKAVTNSFGLRLKAHDMVNLLVSGGYGRYTTDDQIAFWGLVGGVELHFAPKKRIDPFISLVAGFTKEDEEGGPDQTSFSASIGFELKATKFVSILPTVDYDYADNDYVSAGFISPGLSFAFRFSDNPDSFFDNFWIAPFVGANFPFHGDDYAYYDSYSVGVAFVSGFVAK